MAVTKITWENKTGIQNDASVVRKNKVVDEDMNEIKQVVNGNADELTIAKDNIEDLQSGQGTASADITSLKNRVFTLETDNTQNKSDINTLKSDNQTNKSNISTIKGQISDIQQGQTQQNSDIEDLQINDNKQDELISKLKFAALNAETEESKSIHVEDASTIGQLEVLGNQEQETREGKNLLNIFSNRNAGDIVTSNGITFTVNENGSVIANGTATGLAQISFMPNVKFKAGTYTIKDATAYIQSEDYNGWLNGLISAQTMTINSDFTITNTYIQIQSGETVNNKVFYPQLESGSETTEYEQYGASPSPEYPSPVICLGSNKNIFDDSDTYNGYIVGAVGQKISYQSSMLSKTYKSCCELIKNKNYILSFNKNNIANTNVKVCAIADEDENILETFNLNPTEEILITPTNTGYLYLVMDINATNIKIEEGTEATSYSLYRTRIYKDK